MEWVKLFCFRCKHGWFPKNPENMPRICPECKSKYWNQEEPPKPGPRPKHGVEDAKRRDR